MNFVYTCLLIVNDVLALALDVETDPKIQALIQKLTSDLGVVIGAQIDSFIIEHPDWSSE